MNSEKITYSNFFLISDKSLKPFNLDSTIKFWYYYDISNKRFLTFYFDNNDLYILLNQYFPNTAFLGNQVFINPKFIIIKKFDPTLILINFIYSCKENNKYTDIKTLILNYTSILQKNTDYEKNFKFKNSILFIKTIIEKYKENFNLICEYMEDDFINTYKYCESKIILYLNHKINLNENEIKEIKSKPNYDVKDFEEYKKRKIEEKCYIICEFLPPEIKENYFNLKQIQYKYIKPNNEDNSGNIKRKNNNEENKIPKKNGKNGKNKKKENDKNRKIDDIFCKKK